MGGSGRSPRAAPAVEHAHAARAGLGQGAKSPPTPPPRTLAPAPAPHLRGRARGGKEEEEGPEEEDEDEDEELTMRGAPTRELLGEFHQPPPGSASADAYRFQHWHGPTTAAAADATNAASSAEEEVSPAKRTTSATLAGRGMTAQSTFGKGCRPPCGVAAAPARHATPPLSPL